MPSTRSPDEESHWVDSSWGLNSWWEWWESPTWPWYDWFKGLSRCISFVITALRIYLSYKLAPVHGSPAEQETQRAKVNKRCAQRALDLVLSMKGYYIKAAQTLCGAGVFAEEFDDAFAELLDQCPREPFNVVRDILEAELGCAISAVFSEFEKEAIAAASIGQVHLGRLLDGTEVAVKVQYPDVERFFRMDVRGLEFLFWLQGMGEKVREICDSMGLQFEAEFDYTREARHLREVAANVLPHFHDRICIPLPLDAAHPICSRLGVKSLCARKVLTMERVKGVPIRVHTLQLIDAFAKMHGTTPAELRKLIRTRGANADPALVQRLLAMEPVRERTAVAAIGAVRLWNAAGQLAHRVCCCCPAIGARPQSVAVPLNGPRIARTLFEVHGHEIFQDGVYNSDPHAGNIFMLTDGRLGLLDYGAVSRLSLEERLSLARLIVAVADEDDDSVPEAMFACGFQSERMDRRLALLLGYICFHRGPHPEDIKRLGSKVGLPEDCDVMSLEDYVAGGKLDEITRFPAQLLSLQRCSMILSGTALELGAGRLSSAQMLRPQAALLLQEHAKAGASGAVKGSAV
uniref:ABC1 atypical kinase-like domain-containing protein n=1 Tax=Alexandrium monilatum TaxID=311494 RepID=A0A7S4T5K4_9DINO